MHGELQKILQIHNYNNSNFWNEIEFMNAIRMKNDIYKVFPWTPLQLHRQVKHRFKNEQAISVEIFEQNIF